MAWIASVAALIAAGSSALGGVKLLVSDQTSDAIWLLNDANNNNVIDEPGEVSLFYNATNAQGTPAAGNPNGMGARRDGFVSVADFDTTARRILFLHDISGDDDALDAGESSVFATNTTWTNFNSAFGVIFDSCGRVLVSNSGNTSQGTPDGIFLLQDLSSPADGDAEDPGEVASFCTAPPMGPGATASSPAELVQLGSAIYLRDSAGPNQGVTRAVDLNANDNANDAGEFGAFFTAANLSGIALGSGFSIDIDTAHAGALYFNQTVAVPAASTDQIVRIQDLNNVNGANDAGEALVVYNNSEGSAFNIADLCSLPDGSLLVAETGSARVYRFADSDHNNLFANDNSERTIFFNNSSGLILGVRRIARLPFECPADLDNDGDLVIAVPDNGVDINDLLFFLGSFEAGSIAADLDNDGDPAFGVPDCGVDINDLLFFLAHFEGGC